MAALIRKYSDVDEKVYFEETGLVGYQLENYPEP
jgi:hypothetical protein